MGIYIKGMKMPKDDEVIRFIKLLNGKTVAVKEKIKSFSDMYDIVEVIEPHGRFVDIKEIEELMNRHGYDDFNHIDYYSSTVIEAEGE